MKKQLLFGFAFFFLSLSSQAQSTFGLHFNGFLPAGEFKQDAPEVWGAGFAAEFIFQRKQSPLHFGGLIDFNRYGSEVRDGFHGSALGDIRVRRNNNLVRLLGIIRVKPEVNAGFQPYFDLLAGGAYVYTASFMREDAWSSPFDEAIDLDDYSWQYGFGAGIELFLNDFLSLDFHLKKMQGSRTEYLTPASVSYNPEIEGYELEVLESQLDSFTFGFGIKFLWSHLD